MSRRPSSSVQPKKVAGLDRMFSAVSRRGGEPVAPISLASIV
jgi:hypothetical protein